MKPDIRYLSDDTGEIATVADWLYQEWGHLVEGRTLETAKSKVKQSLGQDEIPMTLVCYLNGELVGTAGIDHSEYIHLYLGPQPLNRKNIQPRRFPDPE